MPNSLQDVLKRVRDAFNIISRPIVLSGYLDHDNNQEVFHPGGNLCNGVMVSRVVVEEQSSVTRAALHYYITRDKRFVKV